MHPVLIVDDEPALRLLIRETLGSNNYRIVEAADGEEALAAVEREHPRLVLLDVAMPRLDGVEACRRIKSNPATRDIIVVMLSAKGQEVDRQRGLDAAADAYLTKPFSPLQLLRLVDTL